jgi:hypothetical protein
MRRNEKHTHTHTHRERERNRQTEIEKEEFVKRGFKRKGVKEETFLMMTDRKQTNQKTEWNV